MLCFASKFNVESWTWTRTRRIRKTFECFRNSNRKVYCFDSLQTYTCLKFNRWGWTVQYWIISTKKLILNVSNENILKNTKKVKLCHPSDRHSISLNHLNKKLLKNKNSVTRQITLRKNSISYILKLYWFSEFNVWLWCLKHKRLIEANRRLYSAKLGTSP